MREAGVVDMAPEYLPGVVSTAPSAVAPALLVVRLGRRAYGQTLELQRELARARVDGSLAHDVLLLVEHPPVVTLGRSARDANVVASPALLAARGVECHEVERGGDVTFHGPGQLVGYPIMNLAAHRTDLHWYLRQLEEALIRGLAPYGIQGTRNPGFTGVWVQGGDAGTPASPRKLASIGVHARGWVTWHGFALNVSVALDYFDLIVPCGLTGVTMTSVERELGECAPSFNDVRESVTATFAELFGLRTVEIGVEQLLASL